MLTIEKTPETTTTDLPADPGDDILIDAAKNQKVQRVAGGRGSSLQSHEARAWTMGGQID